METQAMILKNGMHLYIKERGGVPEKPSAGKFPYSEHFLIPSEGKHIRQMAFL